MPEEKNTAENITLTQPVVTPIASTPTIDNKEIIVEKNDGRKTIYLSIKSVAFIVVFTIILLIVLLYINGRGLYDESVVPMG